MGVGGTEAWPVERDCKADGSLGWPVEEGTGGQSLEQWGGLQG